MIGDWIEIHGHSETNEANPKAMGDVVEIHVQNSPDLRSPFYRSEAVAEEQQVHDQARDTEFSSDLEIHVVHSGPIRPHVVKSENVLANANAGHWMDNHKGPGLFHALPSIMRGSRCGDVPDCSHSGEES